MDLCSSANSDSEYQVRFRAEYAETGVGRQHLINKSVVIPPYLLRRESKCQMR